MFNILLDQLPDDFEGWLIRSDYRIGIQIQLCLSDPELSDYERTAVAFRLLFGNSMPDLETARRGMSWFMSCGNPSEPEESEEEPEPDAFSFEMDAGRIGSAFYKVYGIDITKQKMHWFQFSSMLNDLDDTAFTGVINIRKTDPREIDRKKRAEFVRMQRRFRLQKKYSEKEQDKINQFMEQLQ